MNSFENCCCCDGHANNCVICGKPLIYSTETVMRECAICHRVLPSDAVCEDGHFVCDDCHAGGGAAVIAHLEQSAERDPVKLFLETCALPGVHMHGPEHHAIVPCVLLAAYRNCGGALDEPGECIREAWTRGKKVPGGACGFLGVCGAAAGAGIYVSILTDATPLTGDVWSDPQVMTARALEAMTKVGGPRCCKRTGRIAIAEAARYTRERFGVDMPVSQPRCEHYPQNRECLGRRCPFFPAEGG